MTETGEADATEEKKAFRIDSLRQSADGILQPVIDSVFLLVAIRFFAVGDFWTGLIAASNFIGFLLSAPLTGILNRTGVPRSRILAGLTAIAALAMGMGTLSGSGIIFAISVAVSSAAVHLRQPFFTDLYGELYPADRRAKMIALGLRLNLLTALVMGLLYGRILENNLGNWRWITGLCALVLAAGSILLSRLPGKRVIPRGDRWWQALALPFRNPVFVYIQASWMLVGFGNLWTLPLRAVYLAEEERGLGLSPGTVTLILVIIPVAVRLLFNPLWARLYQKLSFPVLRMSLNLFFITSVPLYFLTANLWVIILASVLFGMGTAGSPFIWQLWVTRIVPQSETRIYQSAHAFLAGVRGVVAPFVGFAVLQGLSFRTMGLISSILGLLATVMMLPLLRKDRIF
jgi:MFS family permease